MPPKPSTTAAPSKRTKPPAFKPPRPAPSSKPNPKSKSTSTKPTNPRRKSAPTPVTTISSSSSSPSPSSPTSPTSPAPATSLPQYQDAPPTIPPPLLTRLLHHHFEDEKTRLGKEANLLVGKYMETFVREAIARAAFEREGAEGGGRDFLEVEDLEKLAPQLILDF